MLASSRKTPAVLDEAAFGRAGKTLPLEKLVGLGSLRRTEEHDLGTVGVLAKGFDLSKECRSDTLRTRTLIDDDILDNGKRLSAKHDVLAKRKKGCAADLTALLSD